MLLFAGSSHPSLARELSSDLGRCSLGSFPDGEISVEVLEEVQGKDVFVLQSLALDPNMYLMELLILVDALKRASAKSITAIIPYLCYCRQDRRVMPGSPITAKLVANLLSHAGIDRLVTFDLHSDQIEGFFEVPVMHLHAQPLFASSIGSPVLVVAPDTGSIKTAERMANILQGELVVIKKERFNGTHVRATLLGSVAHRDVLIVDDLCSTASTLVAAAELCKREGAQKIMGAVTHGLFVGDAVQKIEASPLDSLLVTNTVPFKPSGKISQVSVAPILRGLTWAHGCAPFSLPKSGNGNSYGARTDQKSAQIEGSQSASPLLSDQMQ